MTDAKTTIVFSLREVFSTTERSLETLYARTTPGFELVCVDGGSPPKTQAYLERAAEKFDFTLVRTEQFLSPNQARNIGLRFVTTPYVAFVDNDVIVSPGWLTELERCAEETGAWVVGPLYFEHEPEHHRVHMAGGVARIEVDPLGRRYYHERHHHQHRVYHEIEEDLVRHETGLIEFHTVLVDMAAIKELGPLDEGFLSHSEHGDFSMSVRAAGERVFLEPNARITYIPPKRLEKPDRAFFNLRWGEAWAEASIQHMAEKWSLDPDHPEAHQGEKWIRQHRRFGSRGFRTLQRLLGKKRARWITRAGLGKMDVLRNRILYRDERFGYRNDPSVRVVAAPHEVAGS